MPNDRDEKLRKLEPKLDESTAEALWLAAQHPKLRKRVDPLISALSASELEETYKHRKVLLVPPLRGDVDGPILAGEVWYDGPRGALGLSQNEFVRHTGILGMSGEGKSTLGMSLIRQLVERGTRVVVFDVKRTWRSLVEHVPDARVFTLARPEISPFYMNLLIPPEGVDPILYGQIMSRIFDEVLYGGLGSQSIVKAATENLQKLYPMPAARTHHFMMSDLLREVSKLSGQMMRQKRAGDWSATAVRIISDLSSAPLGRVINVRRNVFDDVLEQTPLVIFEMDLFSQPQYTYFVVAFMVREYFKRLNTVRPDVLDMLLVIEEASRIFCQPYPQPTFDTMLREVREKGLGFMWLNQAAEDVNHTAWANTGTLFTFRQNSTRDINAVGSAVAFEKTAEKKYLAMLEKGECIVRLAGRVRFPFLIKTMDVKKAIVSDERIHELSAKLLEELGAPLEVDSTDSEGIKTSEPETQVTQRPEVAQPPMARLGADVRSGAGGYAEFASKQEEYLACMVNLLHESSSNPDKPITSIYAVLGLSKAKGNKIAGMLVDKKLASKIENWQSGNLQISLKPTDRGAEWLARHSYLIGRSLVRWQTNRFGGEKSRVLGELAKRWAQERMGAVKIEAESSDGFAGKFDLRCTRADGSQFVIELVTGESKQHEVLHVQKAAALGLPIYLACWDAGIRSRVARYLEDQNLGAAATLLTKEEIQHADITGRERAPVS